MKRTYETPLYRLIKALWPEYRVQLNTLPLSVDFIFNRVVEALKNIRDNQYDAEFIGENFCRNLHADLQQNYPTANSSHISAAVRLISSVLCFCFAEMEEEPMLQTALEQLQTAMAADYGMATEYLCKIDSYLERIGEDKFTKWVFELLSGENENFSAHDDYKEQENANIQEILQRKLTAVKSYVKNKRQWYPVCRYLMNHGYVSEGDFVGAVDIIEQHFEGLGLNPDDMRRVSYESYAKALENSDIATDLKNRKTYNDYLHIATLMEEL